ncbi:thiamine pyrophosphokinase [Mucilaginibacter lacusdianchii]|uniref:thiamine pyrophosphokinase n=1 Tax=Mucilaginibacter lacusdianchii TaxID=2684211 RepID=UPI00131EB903|nr:thiamine pyrophosphokinase [Mucilaginibacter sp. JXJ CY 39]
MSSHHIVREKQEPALLILGLDQFTDEELGQLLEWSPTVIAVSAMAEQLAIYDIKVDYIIGDEGFSIAQSDVKTLKSAGKPLLNAALEFLIEQGYPAVNIVTSGFDFKTYQAYVGKIDWVVFCNQQKIYPIMSGFSKWKPAGELIEILGPSIELLEEGLAPLTHNQYSTTNDGFFKLTFKEPYLMIAERY